MHIHSNTTHTHKASIFFKAFHRAYFEQTCAIYLYYCIKKRAACQGGGSFCTILYTILYIIYRFVHTKNQAHDFLRFYEILPHFSKAISANLCRHLLHLMSPSVAPYVAKDCTFCHGTLPVPFFELFAWFWDDLRVVFWNSGVFFAIFGIYVAIYCRLYVTVHFYDIVAAYMSPFVAVFCVTGASFCVLCRHLLPLFRRI